MKEQLSIAYKYWFNNDSSNIVPLNDFSINIFPYKILNNGGFLFTNAKYAVLDFQDFEIIKDSIGLADGQTTFCPSIYELDTKKKTVNLLKNFKQL